MIVGHCSFCQRPMMGKDRWAKGQRPAGFTVHGGRGLCRAHHQRLLRSGSPAGATRPPKRIGHCEEAGCTKPIKARKLCSAHYNSARAEGTIEPRVTRPAEEVLEDWVTIRDNGQPYLDVAAARMGMSVKGLKQALYRARKRGDERGSLVPFAHDMRRMAA